MKTRTKVLIGVLSGLTLVGACTDSKEDKKGTSTTTTTVNHTQTTITEPTTSTTVISKAATISKPTTTTAPKPTTTTTKAVTTTTQVPVKTVNAGSFCSPAGATGVTATGLPMTCKTSDTDSRNRWRA